MVNSTYKCNQNSEFTRLSQFLNAESSICITLFGMLTEYRSVQFINASSQIRSTLFGIITFDNIEQFLNAAGYISFRF